MSTTSSFYEITAETWAAAKEIGQYLSSYAYVFRGQASTKWDLATTIERAAKQTDHPLDTLYKAEEVILERFKARAHNYLNSPPKDTELIEWLSIIQDYGGPTRILDFTESFYIAAYFAVESAVDEEGACIWAVDDIELTLRARDNHIINSDTGDPYDPIRIDNLEVLRFSESIISDPSKCLDLVLRVTPPRLNERIALQKGLFLFPCRLDKSFENVLCKMFEFSFNNLSHDNAINMDKEKFLDLSAKRGIVKINLPKEIHNNAIRDLNSMNIDYSTLFPGLDGFAKSLKHSVLLGRRSVLIINGKKKPPSS